MNFRKFSIGNGKRRAFAFMSIIMALLFVFGLTFVKNEQNVFAEEDDSVPVYRLYTPVNGEHLYTTDANEVSVLTQRYQWKYEGVGWYAPTEGKPVYRLYNAILKNHLYTTDTNEVKVLTTRHGWELDNNGKPLFYSGGKVAIYRLYNEGLNGMHLLTSDSNEYKVLPSYGWQREGVKLNCLKKGSSDSAIPNNPSYVDEVIRLVNIERQKEGLQSLKKNEKLCTVANIRANETIKLFSHTRPDGTDCFTILSQHDIVCVSAGENLAMGQPTPAAVVEAWMNSPGHRQNILSPKYTEIGVGAISSDGICYWSQMFTG